MKRFQKALIGVVVSGALLFFGTGGGTAQCGKGYAAISYD